VITVLEKFSEGGWVTLAGTGSVVAICFWVRAHYDGVRKRVAALDDTLAELPAEPGAGTLPALDPKRPTAVVFVTSYGGLGVHTVLAIFKTFPDYFRNLVFLSVGVIDSGEMKGEETVKALCERTEATLARYVAFANGLGLPATSRMALGTDVVEEAERLAQQVATEFRRPTFFSGKLIFKREAWSQRLLHNETAFAVQKRLQWDGLAMVILPVRLR
jgi:hypothetical protein